MKDSLCYKLAVISKIRNVKNSQLTAKVRASNEIEQLAYNGWRYVLIFKRLKSTE